MTSSGEELPTEEMEDELPPLLLAAKEADVASFKKMLEDGYDVLQKDEVRRIIVVQAVYNYKLLQYECMYMYL